MGRHVPMGNLHLYHQPNQCVDFVESGGVAVLRDLVSIHQLVLYGPRPSLLLRLDRVGTLVL